MGKAWLFIYLSIYHDDDQAGRYEEKIKVHKDK